MFLRCWIIGDSEPFLVQGDKEQFIVDLKYAIVAKRPYRFPGVDTTTIELFKKDIPRKGKLILQLSDLGKELDETCRIGDYFEENPPKGNIHVVINYSGK